MRPMSLAESGHSNRAVSLRALLGGEAPRAVDPGTKLRDVVQRIVVGGWPRLIDRSPAEAKRALVSYLDDTRRVDLPRIDGVKRDPENVGRVLRALARNVATPVGLTAIASDLTGREGAIKRHTVSDYLDSLTRVFVIEDLPAWSPSIRSRSRLRESPVRHFVDPSLATAALGVGLDRLLGDPKTLGFLFESLVVRDLRIYAQPLEGSLYHYRDNTGLEADAVLELPDGAWAALEAKLGGETHIDHAAASLLRLSERIDADRHGPPAFLAVVTATGYAYRRRDGVAVIPLSTLGP